MNKDAPTNSRAAPTDSGEVSYLEPPLYHVNPVDAQGSLVTTDWGYDIREFIARVSGLETEIIQLDDTSKGIRAEYIDVLVTTKPIASSP